MLVPRAAVPPTPMNKLLSLFGFFMPAILVAQPTVLIDAIPTGAAFAGVTPLRLPFQDAAKENPPRIEQGLNGAMNGFLPGAAQQGFSFICLLSAPGDHPIEIPIAAAHAKLKLSRTNTAVFVLFYRGGREATVPVTYSTETPTEKKGTVSTTIRLISAPPGGSVAGRIYFNLPRIQAEAEKGKTHTVFVQTNGEGPITAIPIPGLKEPLRVHERNVTFNATWSMDPKIEATHEGEVLGHPMPAPGGG